MPRATETEEFWRDVFTVTEREETALQEHFLQQNQTMSLPAITRFLMQQQHSGLSRGQEATSGIYNPMDSYEVGNKLTFPALNDTVGDVVHIREGNNPRYGEFTVIEVRFPSQPETREFATGISNQNAHLIDAVEEPPLSIDEIYERFGALAAEEVEAALEASDNFVHVGPEWLPRLMLIEFHEGFRNIADAMIDIMGEPLPPKELLKEMPVEDEATEAIKRFSLNYALGQDTRFINRGSGEQPLWHLQRLG
jgi:hypothetical protein